MLLAQISDPHVVCEGKLAYGRVDTPRMLARCVQRLLAQPHRADAVVVTGDLTDHATADEYAQLRALLAPLPMPVYLCVGNHDDRDALRRAFPDHPWLLGEDGFVQYAVDVGALRLVVLDTLQPGAPGGRLCERRLQWLDRTLAASSRPTVIAQHHPPFATGLTVMDTMGLAPADIDALAAVVARHPHVERIVCGHVHRTAHARLDGTTVSICPSSAHQLQLDLVPGADIRFAYEPAGYQMHWWSGTQLVTHTCVVDEFPSWGGRDRPPTSGEPR